MDILKRIQSNRDKARAEEVRKMEPSPVIGLPDFKVNKKPSLREMKNEIVQDMPKPKKVRDFFQILIETLEEDSDNEEIEKEPKIKK
jgi:hypothetical protein